MELTKVRANAMSKPSMTHSQKLAEIMRALMNMATFRQATVTKDTLKLYSERLAFLELEDVLEGCKAIEGLPRDEGETAFPNLATVIHFVNIENSARYNRIQASKDKRLVRWKCPECGVTCSDWVPPGASLYRRCQGIPKTKRIGTDYHGTPICAAELEVAFDEGAS